jgi:hypothetical protein
VSASVPTAAPASSVPAAPATAPAGSAPPVTGYIVPSLGWRILAGGLRLIPLAILLIGLPVAVLTFLAGYGIPPPIPLVIVELAGIALVALLTARYIAGPTIAYGPLAMATSGATIAYLYYLFERATYHFPIPGSGVTISIGYASLVLLLMIGPGLAFVAGALTFAEDWNHPKERLPFDYPA